MEKVLVIVLVLRWRGCCVGLVLVLVVLLLELELRLLLALLLVLAPVLVMVAIPFLYPEALLSASKHPWRAFERHAGELRSAALVVSGSSTAHAVCWTTGRHDVLIGGSPSEFDNELAIDSEAPRRIGWGLVGVRIAEERAAVPPRPVSVVCPMADAATILRATGVAAPDVSVTDGKVCIMHWR